MKTKTLIESIMEAKRFIEAAKKAHARNSIDYPGQIQKEYIYSSKESGAVRRASMDLTRKLADLRAGR
jgi:hypothetical protein